MIDMDFFDKLGKKASEAYKVTADKTGKLAKEAKLRMKMNELKSQINDIYKKIGEEVYQKHIREEEYNINEKLEESCTQIDVLSAEIDTILKECLELKDKKQCPNCFKEIEKNVKFCPSCGAKQEEIVKEAEVVEEKTEKQENKNEQESDNESNLQQVEEENNLEKTVEVESNPKLENGENVQEISYTEADEVEQQ